MAIEKVIDINIQSNADERVGSLRSQLRQAQADVATLSDKFGVTSKEAADAAKRAAELKDRIGDAKALTDAFNPDAKFKALSSSLAGVAGGFAALQGAQSLFGEQSKEVEQTLLKVQAAMALSQGLQTIGESIDSFKQLGAVAKSYTIVQRIVTAGQWLWNAALAANPIGALVVVIAALIAAGVALVNYFKGASAAAAQNTAAVKENEKAIKNQSKTLDENSKELDRKQKHELAMAKASGASASAIRALELKLIDEKIAYEKSAKAVAMNTYEKNKNYLMSLKASGADEDLIKKQTEVVNESVKQVNKQSENLKKAYDERKDIQLRHQVEVRQAQTNHNKEVADKNKEASDKAKEIYNELPEIEGGVYKVTLPFSHMKFERLYNIFDNGVTDIQWGYSANDNFNAATGNYESSLNKPLLFYPIYNDNVAFSFKKTTSTHQEITKYILPSNSVYLDPTTGTANINFKAELNEWTATNDFTDTLFFKYYQDYIMQVFNPKNRLTKIKAILPISIFMNLKLNDRFKIVDRLFRINKITTNLTNGESDIELLNEL